MTTRPIPVTTGTRIGTATAHKVGFFGHNPVLVPDITLVGPWLFIELLRFFVQAGWFSKGAA